jgi:hypothetical protein
MFVISTQDPAKHVRSLSGPLRIVDMQEPRLMALGYIDARRRGVLWIVGISHRLVAQVCAYRVLSPPWILTLNTYPGYLPWILTLDTYPGYLPWILTLNTYPGPPYNFISDLAQTSVETRWDTDGEAWYRQWLWTLNPGGLSITEQRRCESLDDPSGLLAYCPGTVRVTLRELRVPGFEHSGLCCLKSPFERCYITQDLKDPFEFCACLLYLLDGCADFQGTNLYILRFVFPLNYKAQYCRERDTVRHLRYQLTLSQRGRSCATQDCPNW